jgi:asparagine synthase (glutamine-hydrolysing)
VLADRTGLKGPYKYWQVAFARAPAVNGLSARTAAARVRDLLTQAVARRLISDVPLGAFLSGGLDSSVVVGIMSRLLKEPVRTFTIGFADDHSFDERSYATMAARHFGTDHTEFVVNTDAISLMELLLWHHDQPYGDSSAIPTYLVSRLARQHVTVVLTGDGGDEVFGGYDRFLGALLAAHLPHFIVPMGRAIAHCVPRQQSYYSIQRRLERFLEQAEVSVEERFLGWMSYFNLAGLRQLLRPEYTTLLDEKWFHTDIHQWLETTKDLPLLHRLMHRNFMTYLPDDLHVKIDRMSMANALETRAPMLDTALVEFVASLAPDLKIRRTQMKYILKLAFQDMLPPALLKRKKHGFGVPLGHWFRHQLRPYVEEVLLTADARLREYFDQESIRRLVTEHVEGVGQHWNRLWILLNFELWLRMLADGTLWTSRTRDNCAPLDVTQATRHSYS